MKQLDICFASDDSYAPFMGVAVSSIVAHAKSQERFRFHILDNGISPLNKRRIASLKKAYPNFSVCYYPVSQKALSRLPIINSHLSSTAYARLFVASLLPADLQRVIYLDCDVFVRGSLAPLFETDLQGCILGGVEDLGIKDRMNRGVFPWVCKKGEYINSGVLLIDLKCWRETKTEQALCAYLRQPRYPLLFEDQDAINFVLDQKIKILAPAWNGQMYWGHSEMNKIPGIKQLRQLLLECPIVHFASPAKPWIRGSGWHTNSRQYKKWMENSPWAASCRRIPLTRILGGFLRYLKVHPCCFLKPRFYQEFYWQGVQLFR